MFSVIPAPPSSRSQWSNVHARNDLQLLPCAFSDEPVRQKMQTINTVNDRRPQLAMLALGERKSMSSCCCYAGFSISSSSHSYSAPSPALLTALDIDFSSSCREMRPRVLCCISRSVVVEGVLGNLVLLANDRTTSSALQRRKFLRNLREMTYKEVHPGIDG